MTKPANNKQNQIDSNIAAMAENGLYSEENAQYIKDVILGLNERFGVEPREVLSIIKNQLLRNSALEDWGK